MMKGDKNMLYFYSCEITSDTLESFRICGVIERGNKFINSDDFQITKKELDETLIHNLKEQFPDLSFNSENVLYTAFNPL